MLLLNLSPKTLNRPSPHENPHSPYSSPNMAGRRGHDCPAAPRGMPQGQRAAPHRRGAVQRRCLARTDEPRNENGGGHATRRGAPLPPRRGQQHPPGGPNRQLRQRTHGPHHRRAQRGRHRLRGRGKGREGGHPRGRGGPAGTHAPLHRLPRRRQPEDGARGGGLLCGHTPRGRHRLAGDRTGRKHAGQGTRPRLCRGNEAPRAVPPAPRCRRRLEGRDGGSTDETTARPRPTPRLRLRPQRPHGGCRGAGDGSPWPPPGHHRRGCPRRQGARTEPRGGGPPEGFAHLPHGGRPRDGRGAAHPRRATLRALAVVHHGTRDKGQREHLPPAGPTDGRTRGTHRQSRLCAELYPLGVPHAAASARPCRGGGAPGHAALRRGSTCLLAQSEMERTPREAEPAAREAARRTRGNVAAGGGDGAVETELLHQRFARLPHAAHPHRRAARTAL